MNDPRITSSTYNCQKDPVYTEYSTISMIRPKFNPALLYDQPFSRYKLGKNQKYMYEMTAE